MHGLQLGVSMGATMASSFSAAEETTKFKRRPAHARAAAGVTPAAATGSCRWHRRRAPELQRQLSASNLSKGLHVWAVHCTAEV